MNQHYDQGENNERDTEYVEHEAENEHEEQPENPLNQQQAEQFMALISYIGILWIVPVLAAKDSEFAMYHANQGLNLFIVEVALFLVAMIPLLGWLIGFFGWLAVLVLAIMGIMNVLNNEKKALPIIGGFQLLNQLDLDQQ